METGPVQYIVIEFPGNKFTGQIVPALQELIDAGTVRVIDLVFVTKNEAGEVHYDEYDAGEQGDGFGFASLEGEAGELFSDQDILQVAEMLEANSSAVVLVWEDCWAAKFAGAVREAGGEIISGARVPRQLVEQALAAQASAAAPE